MVFTGGKAPPHPPFMTYSLSGKETGSPHPPRITRRLVRLLRLFCLLVCRLFLEKGFKDEKNLVKFII